MQIQGSRRRTITPHIARCSIRHCSKSRTLIAMSICDLSSLGERDLREDISRHVLQLYHPCIYPLQLQGFSSPAILEHAGTSDGWHGKIVGEHQKDNFVFRPSCRVQFMKADSS